MKRRGSGLVAVMTIAALVSAFACVVLSCASAARQQVAQRKYLLEARAMAHSGLDYARAMLGHGRWRQDRRYASPDLNGGSFVVSVSRSGAGWTIRSTGSSGARSLTVEGRFP